jgi:hypothetical protein
MYYRLAVLMLFIMLPVMNVLAAPVPAPSAVLQIELPPKDWNMEKHLESVIDHLTAPYGMPFAVWLDPEIRKLPSVAAKKDVREGRSWIAKNIRITQEDGGCRLRLTFRAGTRREQVAILNTLLRVYIKATKDKQKFLELCLAGEEDGIPELERRIASGQHNESIDRYRKAIEDARSIHIPARKAEIERYKKIAVIKWAQ